MRFRSDVKMLSAYTYHTVGYGNVDSKATIQNCRKITESSAQCVLRQLYLTTAALRFYLL